MIYKIFITIKFHHFEIVLDTFLDVERFRTVRSTRVFWDKSINNEVWSSTWSLNSYLKFIIFDRTDLKMK